MGSTGTHILVFPYPAQGHMIPILDLTNQLATTGLTITILVTPKNLPLLHPILSTHPSIKTLVLPFPPHPSIPPGLENAKDLPANYVPFIMQALGELYEPLLNWFKSHPSPPSAIISDMFLGWTQHLACLLNIRRIVFSPSGAMALSVIYSLWRDMPKVDQNDHQLIFFSKIPNCPTFPLCQVSPMYRRYIAGDPLSEFIKDGFQADIASWGLVFNSFTELECVYLDHLRKELGHDRVWAVGPLLPPKYDAPKTKVRVGPTPVSVEGVMTFLDTCKDHSVVYICFGSQTVLTNHQMEELASGLEKSGIHFIWCLKEPTRAHDGEGYGKIPLGFENSVVGRGLIVRGWVSQVLILSHRAIGAFLTHCGWNSILEGIVAGVPMLAWPMGADQFTNATLLVDVLKWV
ncbi:hypothetical protein GH714_003504 [Hevea brasiliensis]|uniref:Glycosyltransferase n=1 Tax=Hevea brasiliensis TaxID=3981 RepID=A0A6A6KBM9_HEVBR|nr:hypothetical protein GH714_003504 [Hevea brasiliensis]